MIEFSKKSYRRNGQKCVDVIRDGQNIGYLLSVSTRRWKLGISLCASLGVPYHGRRPASSLAAAKEEVKELVRKG